MKNSLENHFVVAMPSIVDPFFGRSIVYIFHHDNDATGTRGLIINKPFLAPTIANPKGLFMPPSIYKHLQAALDTSTTIFLGGPIDMMSKCTILHSSDYNKNSAQISDDICLNDSKEALQDIKNNQGPKKFRFILGFAGWGPGQLEEEVKNGDWLLKDGSADFIFDTPDNSKWETAFVELGLDVSQLTMDSAEA